MNITINVDEAQFKDLLEKELNEMPKEEVHELVKIAFIQYVTQDPKALKDLFVKQSNNYYDSSVSPTNLLNKIIKEIDFSDIAAEIAEPIKDLFKNGIKDIVEQVVARSIADAIMSNISTSGLLERSFMQFYYNQKSIEANQQS